MIDLTPSRCAPLPLHDCGDWPILARRLQPLLDAYLMPKSAALLEAQRPSRGPVLRLNVRSHEAAREQHRRLTANSRQNVILP